MEEKKTSLCYLCENKNICKYIIEVMGIEDAIKTLTEQYNIPIISTSIVCEKRQLNHSKMI